MKIAIVTNAKAPYRSLQIKEFAKISDVEIKVYYTDKNFKGRAWDVSEIDAVREINLEGYSLSSKEYFINKRLGEVVKNNDIIIIGGYEKPSYILLSLLCRIYNKPYVLLYDGISPDRVGKEENRIKHLLKNIVVSGAEYIFGNGQVSKAYFSENFGYDKDSIYNQTLTVDVDKIQYIGRERTELNKKIRKRYGIEEKSNVIIYSGRLIERKNVDLVIKAISEFENKSDFTLLIIGDGEIKEYLVQLAAKLEVKVIVTGFLKKQEELFEHYFCGQCLILPSSNEPWGLVLNEAIAAGLPIICSDQCGAYLDLVHIGENGYVVKTGDYRDVFDKLRLLFEDYNSENYYKANEAIIDNWKFKNSREQFELIIKNIIGE